MKKRRVKAMVGICLVSMLLMTMTGCQKKEECDWCKEMKVCQTSKNILGQEEKYCDECIANMEKAGDALEEMFQ